MGTLQDAEIASERPDYLLVDARREEDFRQGSISRAVNIPVNASFWAISKYLAKLDRDTPIVVFCQSAQCIFNKTVADQIMSLEFKNVTVCDEGWSEYIRKHRK